MTIEQTLAERGNRYGDFSDHAKIAQAIQDDMRIGPGWPRLDDVKRQALTVIADKIARILSGDPNYADNWHDIQGYAKLVEDRLPPEIPADFVQQHTIEPASLIDDESPRQQAIGQNGNTGEHYDDVARSKRWESAPTWATHIVERLGYFREFARLCDDGALEHGPEGNSDYAYARSTWTICEARP